MTVEPFGEFEDAGASDVVQTSRLQALVDRVEAARETDDALNASAPLSAALQSANAILGNALSTQLVVDGAHEQLAAVYYQETRVALDALIEDAEEAIADGGYTQMSLAALDEALGEASDIAANASATQRQIDVARKRLGAAFDALVPLTVIEFEEGAFYLVTVLPRYSDLSGPSSMAGYFDAKAVVEVKEDRFVVHVFHTKDLERVSNLKYDHTQNDNNVQARLTLVPVIRQIDNPVTTTRAITVDWADETRSLMIGMEIDRSPAMGPLITDARLIFDLESAVEMTDPTYLGFDFSEQGALPDKVALLTLVETVEALNATDYTSASFEKVTTALNAARIVLADENALQAQIDAAYNALSQAQGALITKTLVKSLEDLIVKAEKEKAAGYTPASFAALTSAIAQAKNALAKADVTKSEIENARTQLQAALDGLLKEGMLAVGKRYLVDFSARNANDLSVASSAAGYYHGKAVVEVKSDGAIVHFFQTSAFKETARPIAYDYRYDSVQSDVNATDKLIGAETEVNAANDAMRIEVAWPDLQRSLLMYVRIDTGVAGMPIMNNPMRMVVSLATIQELTAPTYMGFGFAGPQVDKTQLQNLVDACSKLKSAAYTPQSFTALTSALNKAKAALADPAATAEQINEAYSTLEKAQKGLKAPANKTALKTQITRAGKVKRADYTATTLSVMDAALKAAKAADGNANATQADVDAAQSALKKAIDGLKKRPTGTDVVDKANMTDGRYTVQVDFWHQDKTGPSNANPSLNHTAIIDVKGGKMTMSISTKPIKVGEITAVLRALTINGADASVIARNITLNGTSYASAFSFPLPNKDLYQSAVFHLTANPGPTDPPGWLRIGWDTLQSAPNAGLSSDTTIANATRSQEELDRVARTNKKTDQNAAKPVMTTKEETATAAAATGAPPTSGTTADADQPRAIAGAAQQMAQMASGLPWYGWGAIGLGIAGIFAAGWFAAQRFLARKRDDRTVTENVEYAV
jgi:hypothetical protein